MRLLSLQDFTCFGVLIYSLAVTAQAASSDGRGCGGRFEQFAGSAAKTTRALGKQSGHPIDLSVTKLSDDSFRIFGEQSGSLCDMKIKIDSHGGATAKGFHDGYYSELILKANGSGRYEISGFHGEVRGAVDLKIEENGNLLAIGQFGNKSRGLTMRVPAGKKITVEGSTAGIRTDYSLLEAENLALAVKLLLLAL